MNVFGYAYYKFSRPYKRLEGQYYYIAPIMLLSMCQAFNVISLLPFVIRFHMNNWIISAIGAFFILTNANYFLSKRKREQYEHRWSKEKGAKKRWGTVAAIAYIVFSMVGYFASMPYDLGYTGWKMTIPEGWRLALKVQENEASKIEKKYNVAGIIAPAASSVTWLIAFEKDKYNAFRSSYEIPICANEDNLKKSINVERDFLPNLFPPPIEIISVHPIVKETVNSISFYSYTYECFLPEPINKKIIWMFVYRNCGK